MRSGAVSLVGAFLGLGLGLAPSARGAALEGLQGPTAQATPTPTPPPPPLVAAGLPIKFGASLTIRNDTIDVADQTDLLLDDQTSALRARFRLWLDYRDPSAVVNAGLRFGSAQNPNPTASFIRLGNAFRWELTELGYSKMFVETATEGLVVYVSRKDTEPVKRSG